MSDKTARDRQDGMWGFSRDIDSILADHRHSRPSPGGDAPAGAERPGPQAGRRRRQRRIAAAGLVGAALLLVAAAWWGPWGREEAEGRFASEFLRAVATCGLRQEADAEPNRRIGATTIARLVTRLEQGRPVGTFASRTYAYTLRRWRDCLSAPARDEYARRCIEAEHRGVNMKEDREFAGGGGLGFLETAWNMAADGPLRNRARAVFDAEAAARFAEATAEWNQAVREHEADASPSKGPPPEKPRKQEMADWDSLRRGRD